jgi:NADH-quinone oxidoreductase subunit F/NADP-reducing hydrogenase subunit HndC
VLSTIKYFREEYEEHVYEKYCRANVCSDMGAFVIDQNACIRCGLCKEACAFDAVTETRNRYMIERSACTQCKACYTACPIDAVLIKKPRHVTLEEALKIPTENIEIFDRRAKMVLRDIIKKKSTEIITLTEDDFAIEAIKTMVGRKISNVLVVDENGKLKGIFTERDVVRCTGKNIPLDKVPLKNIMTKNIIAFDPSVEISAAIQVVSREKIRHLPVVENDKIIGIVTYRDLVSHVLPEVIYMAEAIY